jgi:hypothetical protein
MKKEVKQKINSLHPLVREKLIRRLAAEQVEKKLEKKRVEDEDIIKKNSKDNTEDSINNLCV